MLPAWVVVEVKARVRLWMMSCGVAVENEVVNGS